MAEFTKIEWVDHTFNPWIGCTRISDACDNCYAASMSHRRGWARFETGAPRKRTTAAYWRQPLLWNKKAAARGMREKVFGPSLADPFDPEVDDPWRRDYLEVIEATPWLDYILLTKRPQVAVKFFDGRKVPDNLWPGITAENQKMLDLRMRSLATIDARVLVVSAEPVLGPLDASLWMPNFRASEENKIGWVIAGGESGPKARPSHPDWFRKLRDQCQATDVPFFFKQWGEWRGYAPTEHKPAGRWHNWNGGHVSVRVGKKAAGAELDGREWREVPK